MCKIIILAAGSGSRLKPYTDNIPKCMVNLLGRSLLQRQLDVVYELGIEDITIVTGYKSELIRNEYPAIKHYVNDLYASTNMAHSLFVARDQLTGDEDVIITYGDIIYQKNVIEALIAAEDYSIYVVVDKSWHTLWQARMEDPLSDAESMVLDEDNCILEIGKKCTNIDNIQGQYIGMIKITAEFLNDFLHMYDAMDRNAVYDGKDFNNMYMTSLLQYAIHQGTRIKAVLINNGWLELDSVSDLNCYNNLAVSNKLNKLIDMKIEL